MKKEKKSKVDWSDIRANIRATCVAIFVATIIKHYIFMDKLVEYNLLRDLFIFMALYIPVYVLMLFLQVKFKTKK